jgi:hypothetical protein
MVKRSGDWGKDEVEESDGRSEREKGRNLMFGG